MSSSPSNIHTQPKQRNRTAPPAVPFGSQTGETRIFLLTLRSHAQKKSAWETSNPKQLLRIALRITMSQPGPRLLH